MKRLNKILAAVQKFASKDYTYRNLNAIKFDLNRQTIEVTDGHAGIIIKGDKDFIVSMANEYAEYLGIDPVGSDFTAVKLAPKNGKWYPNAERLSDDEVHRGDLFRVLRFGDHDPEFCKKSVIFKDQLPRLNQFCKAVRAKLHLIPGTSPVSAMMQYGKGQFNGMNFIFCIAQMPCHRNLMDDEGNPKTEAVTYESLDEIDQETMKQFEKMVK
jgi:hypothetical protein